MKLSQRIKEDYGTVKRMSDKEKICYGSLRNFISGKGYYPSLARKLVSLGYADCEESLLASIKALK